MTSAGWTLPVRATSLWRHASRQLGQAGDAVHQCLCGGTGLFSHKGRCAHGAGSSPARHDLAPSGKIFSERQPAATGGHDSGDWAGACHDRRAPEGGGLRKRFPWQMAHGAERRKTGQGGGRAFAVKPGVRHQHWRRSYGGPPSFSRRTGLRRCRMVSRANICRTGWWKRRSVSSGKTKRSRGWCISGFTPCTGRCRRRRRC